MLIRKLFLASSNELEADRREFELFVGRKNKEWVPRGVYLDLVVWENFLDAMSATRKQDDYNKAIRECDLLLVLYSTKVGRYTAEEFANAHRHFRETGKPQIFTYFKDVEVRIGSIELEQLESLTAFRRKLKELEHFETVYTHPAELKVLFQQQIDKLDAQGFWGAGQDGSPGGNADLVISSVRAPRRLTPLDGHPFLQASRGPSPLYTGGFNVSFTLGHNGEGRHAINLHAIELQVVRFTRGEQAAYTYAIDGAEVIGAGVAKPHVFSLVLHGNRADRAHWVTDAKMGTFEEARSDNLLDTPEPKVLTFAPGGENEEIRGTVIAQETGLYELQFVFHYSVAGDDRVQRSEAIHVYSDE